jgi:DNA-directed RNA polymerase sigma subunit (sigma70/sigma32)
MQAQPAMSFEEIAKHFGVTKVAIRQTYLNAVKKIRNDKQAMENFRFLLHEREHERYNTWRLSR